jgi:2-dehydropantoate 2-reductase
MSRSFSKIAVVGSGAVGLYYGTHLALGGADVRFLLRGDLAAVRERGIVVRIGERELRLPPERVGAFASTAEIGPVDLVVVALKTTANDQLAALLPPLLGPQTAVLTLQNGLGADELLAALCGAERVLGGLTFIASSRVAPGEVFCFSPGWITLGEFGRAVGERARAIAALFARSGVRCEVTDNLREARWRKLVWNVPFSGLTIAAGGITTDRVLADPALAAEARALMDEVAAAAQAQGLSISPEFIEQQFSFTPTLGAYKPSSLLDWEAGRAVEVEAIWGEPLRRAQAAGAEMPRLARLYARIRQQVAASSRG